MTLLPKRSNLYLSFIPSLIIFFCTPMAYADNVIATLTDFSRTVLIKSRGSWGVEPKLNLPLYSEDKVVTRIGNATITFHDGATLKIKSNSNLLIQERETGGGHFREGKGYRAAYPFVSGKAVFQNGEGRSRNSFRNSNSGYRNKGHSRNIKH